MSIAIYLFLLDYSPKQFSTKTPFLPISFANSPTHFTQILGFFRYSLADRLKKPINPNISDEFNVYDIDLINYIVEKFGWRGD
jgi:hypothetical protein